LSRKERFHDFIYDSQILFDGTSRDTMELNVFIQMLSVVSTHAYTDLSITFRNFFDPFDNLAKNVLIDCGSGIRFPAPLSRKTDSTAARFFFARRIAERRRIQSALLRGKPLLWNSARDLKLSNIKQSL
jgi:hypothetical protein